MDAISVPNPPRLQPINKLSHWLVNPDKRRAAGTLLITWLAKTETSTSRPARAADKKAWKLSIPDTFPIKIKKARKVPKRE